MERLTAAHRTRPFDSWVRVTNLENGKTVDVRINDRGPFVRRRIIDLSLAAARAIDMIGPGTAMVHVQTIPLPFEKSTPAGGSRRPLPASPLHTPEPAFSVQVGAFADRSNAERMCAGMAARFGSARMIWRDDEAGSLWRVFAGAASEISEAESLASQIRTEGSEAFVLRVDGLFGQPLECSPQPWPE